MSGVVVARRFHQFEVMGTVFSFDVRTGLSSDEPLHRAEAWLHEMDAVFSTYRPDSAVNRLARKESRLADLPPEVAEVLGLCAAASERTGGWFTAQPGGRFDPSGMVKGWAIDGVAHRLMSCGAEDFVINGGGDVLAYGVASADRPWRVGIADPFDKARALAVVEVPTAGAAVATSGTAARGGHVLNPFSGQPVLGLASVSVLGLTMTETDMLATTALAMGPPALGWLEKQPGVEAFVVDADGALAQTTGWPGQLLA